MTSDRSWSLVCFDPDIAEYVSKTLSWWIEIQLTFVLTLNKLTRDGSTCRTPGARHPLAPECPPPRSEDMTTCPLVCPPVQDPNRQDDTHADMCHTV